MEQTGGGAVRLNVQSSKFNAQGSTLTATATITPTRAQICEDNIKTTPPEISIEPNEKNVYNYPNPCKGQTSIRFPLPEQQQVKIAIYDMNGRIIWRKELSPAETIQGINSVSWNGENDLGQETANGIYFCRVVFRGITITKKIAVIR